MQNRFTVKDFFYMLIGLVVCLLLFLNMYKTDREAAAIEKVEKSLERQQTTLSGLSTAIDNLSGSVGLDQNAIDALMAAANARSSAGTNNQPAANQSTSNNLTANNNQPADPDRPVNVAEYPSYEPGYSAEFPVWTKNVNRRGQPQQWLTAPDAELPDDFAPGDSLIMVWQTDAQKLTPLVATDAYARRVHWYTSEYLVLHDLDAPFGYTPGLAKAWEVSPDGMELTFHLYENATWSDGEPVTADDVIFTWDAATNERMDTAHLRGYINDNVASWEKIDTHSIRFTMKQPYFDAVGVVGQLLLIIPEHVYGDFDEETFNNEIPDVLVGSGPFVLDEWVKNDRIVLKRNENYWGPKAPLEEIVIRIIPNELSALQEFKAENVDMIERPTAEQYTQNVDADWFRNQNKRGHLYYSPRGGYAYLGYNLRKPFFADKRTRQALTMLVDRQALIDTLADGMGALITGPFYFKSDQYNHEVEPWPYNPDRARELLREVGWEDTDRDGVLDKDLDGDGIRDPFEFTFLVPSGSTFAANLQRFVQNAFKQAGIVVSLDSLEWSVFLERLNTREYDMTSLSWTGQPEGDPYQIWHSESEANRGSNHVGFKNERADELIEMGRRELDYEKRMDIWHEFHALLHEEQPYTFLFGRPMRSFVDGRFHNAEPYDYRFFYGDWYVPAADQVR